MFPAQKEVSVVRRAVEGRQRAWERVSTIGKNKLVVLLAGLDPGAVEEEGRTDRPKRRGISVWRKNRRPYGIKAGIDYHTLSSKLG